MLNIMLINNNANIGIGRRCRTRRRHHRTFLYYTMLYYTIIYYTILYYTMLYYTKLNYTILLLDTLAVIIRPVRFRIHGSRLSCP